MTGVPPRASSLHYADQHGPESAITQAKADFDAKAAAHSLRFGAGKGSVSRAVETDIAAGRLAEIQGWVLPLSLVMVAAIAAEVSEKNG